MIKKAFTLEHQIDSVSLLFSPFILSSLPCLADGDSEQTSTAFKGRPETEKSLSLSPL